MSQWPPGHAPTCINTLFVDVYSETLPVDAPPSYRGVTLKYSYKVTVGAQRFGCPTKLLRLPFRVLVVPGC